MINKSITFVTVLFAAFLLLGFPSVIRASTVSGYGYMGSGNAISVYFESDASTIGTDSTALTDWSYLLINVPGYQVFASYDSLTTSTVSGVTTITATAEGYLADYSAYVNVRYTLKKSATQTTLAVTLKDYYTGKTLSTTNTTTFAGYLLLR